MRRSRTVQAALGCYPSWWHGVYGAEARQLADDLLDEGRSQWWLAANLARGALAARVTGHGMPARLDLWRARTRASIAVTTLAWVAVLPLVALGLSGSVGARTLSGRAVSASAPWSTHVATDAYQALQIAIVVGLFVGLVGWRALRWGVSAARGRRRRREIALLCVVAGPRPARGALCRLRA